MSKKEVRTRALSSYMFETEAGVYSVSLPPAPSQAANVFKKISSFIKHHNISMATVLHELDKHGDNVLTFSELRQGVVSQVGCHISVAEGNFVGRYLEGLGTAGTGEVSILDFEAALVMHKPPPGKK